jgi:hypothetical protein
MQQLNKSFEQSIEQQKMLEQQAKFYKKNISDNGSGSKLKERWDCSLYPGLLRLNSYTNPKLQ